VSALHTVLSEQADEDADLEKCKTSMCHVGKMEKDVDSACSKGNIDLSRFLQLCYLSMCLNFTMCS
jgi:hypothetical protein